MAWTDTADVGTGACVENRWAKSLKQAPDSHALAVLYEFTRVASLPDCDGDLLSPFRDRCRLRACRLGLASASAELRSDWPMPRLHSRFATCPTHELCPDEMENGAALFASRGRAEKPSSSSAAAIRGESPTNADGLQFRLEFRTNV